MKNYLTEWKKFKNNILNEGAKADAVKREVDLATKLGQEKLKNAQAEDKAEEEKKKAQLAADQAEKKAAVGSGTSGTTGTSSTIPEELEGRPADRMGKQPVSVQEEELTEEELEEASGEHEGMEEGGGSCKVTLEYDEMEEEKACNECKYCKTDKLITEAKYKGRTVPLGKPMRGDVKKFKVFVRDPKTGNVKKVNFGDKKMRIKKSNPKRRKSFRARHNCANPGPRTKARYWSCRKW